MEVYLTKEFHFEMAHALQGYDGACKNIHGHSYRLFVTIAGEPNQDIHSPKYGMVMDFGELKKIINEAVISIFDHALVLNEKTPFENTMHTHCIQVPFQPTCENMLIYFAEIIQPLLPGYIKLKRLKMHETASSFAELFL